MNKFIVYKQPSGKPWLDANLRNYVRDEISYAVDPIPLQSCKPDDFFKWLCKNGAEDVLLNGLANLAPLFPTESYYGEASSWIAPPPSGSGNAVVIIMGQHNGKIEIIGGNYFDEFPNIYKRNAIGNFWDVIATKSLPNDKPRYMSLYLQQNMTDEDCNLAKRITMESNVINTMPVYLMAIDGDKHHFWAMPAIVYGHHPSDMKLEKMWGYSC